jgi:YihY family inner membrane protein
MKQQFKISDNVSAQMFQSLAGNMQSKIFHFFDVLYKAAYRFYYDDGFSRASGLSYTTLFALVPLTALAILGYSVFGINEEEIEENIASIVTKILPSNSTVELGLNLDTGDNLQLTNLRNEIVTTLLTLAGHAKTLGILTITILFFISVSLLNTIESALNTIWRTNSSRVNFLQKLVNFWAVISLGTLLLPLSIYLTGNFGILEIGTEGLVSFPKLIVFCRFMFSVLITSFALSLLFHELPATKVRYRDAFLGGFVAAILFEVVKIGFSYYLSKSTSYAAIYGALATFPLFLFWMYLGWVVVLYGAEVANLSGSLEVIREIDRYSSSLGEIGPVLGLRVMLLYAKAFARGEKQLTESDLCIQTGVDSVIIRNCVDLLSFAKLLTPYSEENKVRTINRSLDLITVQDIVNAFVNRNDGNNNDLYILNLVMNCRNSKELKDVTIDELVKTI